MIGLLAAVLLSQGLSPNAPGVTGGGKVLWQAPFSTPGCYASGQTAGASSAISITRTTTATVALTSDPSVLTTCAAGEFRVDYQGLLVEPARTNYALQSNTMSTGTAATSGWVLAGAGTSVATVAGAPMGGTWAELSGTLAAASINIASITSIPSYTSATASVWAAKASGTGPMTIQIGVTGWAPTCSCSRSDGGACTTSVLSTHWCAAVTTIGTTPVRVSVTGTGTASTASSIYLNPGDRTAADAAATTRFSGAQLEVGTYPTSLIVTTSTATARNADAVSATVPAVPAGASGKWAINVAGMSYGDPSTTQANLTQRVWSLGTTGANTASLDVSQAFVVTDAAAGVKTFTTTGAPGRSTQRVTAMDKGGTLSLLSTGATTGAGTGVLTTPPTTLYFGSASGTSLHLGGFIKGLKICGPVTKIGDCK